MRSLLPPVNISDANESNQANRMSINQYHLGRRMNSVPGEEYFSCIVLRRTGIGPFDFGWWASSSWNNSETPPPGNLEIISKSTAGAIFCYFTNKGLVNLFILEDWPHLRLGTTVAGERVGTAIEQGRQSPTFKPNWAFAFFCFCSTVPRSTANESNLSTHTFPLVFHVRSTLLFPNAATTKPSPGTKSMTDFVTC